MAEETQKPSTPPYVPYKTFTNFISGLSDTGVPSQIDKSIMRSLSGSVQSALVSSLKYLNLIENDGTPADRLAQLVESKEKQRADILRSVLVDGYPFLFASGIDLKKATTKQIEQAFRDQGAGGSTVVKCIAFFLEAAKEASIQISPHVKTPPIQRSAAPKRASANSAPIPNSELPIDATQTIPTDSVQLRLPVPGKDDVLLVFPKGFGKEDWDFLKPIFEAYLAKMFAEGGR